MLLLILGTSTHAHSVPTDIPPSDEIEGRSLGTNCGEACST